MRLASVKISNYKSFRQSDKIELDSGFNVVIGKNNVGKTALLEAASLRLQDRPHLSEVTKPRLNSVVQTQASFVEAAVTFGKDELIELANNLTLTLNFAVQRHNFSNPHQRYHYADGLLELYSEATLILRLEPGNSHSISVFGANDMQNLDVDVMPLTFNGHGKSPFIPIGIDGTIIRQDSEGERALIEPILASIYRFQAERMNVGRAMGLASPELASNASNLPLAISNLLTTNPYASQRLMELVRNVLPDIHGITTQEVEPRTHEIRVWSIDQRSQRPDLAFPLTECGTGLGQVLAILYVVLTAQTQQVIIVDEPQSFLHPGALRKLIDILRYEPRYEHQYIFSSHSPQIIASSAPTAFHLVSKVGMESEVQRFDSSDVERQRELLAELGSSMADILSADSIIWVEGSTEEQAFPLILSHFNAQRRTATSRLFGTAILSVVATGDLEGKSKRRIADIYRKLSANASILPPTLAFVLDPERKTLGEKNEIEKSLGVDVRWLPRSMYENYLLSPDAIADLIRTFEMDSDQQPNVEEVAETINQLLGEKRFYGSAGLPREVADRLKMVHGTNVLDAIIKKYANHAGYDYKSAKIEYGIHLTRWLLDHSADELYEVFCLLSNILLVEGEAEHSNP